MFKNLLALLILVAGITISMQLIAPHTSIVTESINYNPSQARTDDSPSAVKSAVDESKEYTDYLSEWKSELNVSVSTDAGYSSNANYVWENVDDSVHQSELAYYQSFDEEISKYSASFFDKAGVSRIVLVDNITTKTGIAVLGFADPVTGEISIILTRTDLQAD